MFQEKRSVLIQRSIFKYREHFSCVNVKKVNGLSKKEALAKLLDEHLEKDSLHYGLTRNDICRMAYILAKWNHFQHPFSDFDTAEKKMVEIELSIRRPTCTSSA